MSKAIRKPPEHMFCMGMSMLAKCKFIYCSNIIISTAVDTHQGFRNEVCGFGIQRYPRARFLSCQIFIVDIKSTQQINLLPMFSFVTSKYHMCIYYANNRRATSWLTCANGGDYGEHLKEMT